MRKSIYWRLLSSFIAVLFAVIVPLSMILNVLFMQILSDRIESSLRSDAINLSLQISMDLLKEKDLKRVVFEQMQKQQEKDVFLWLIDAQGNRLDDGAAMHLTEDEQRFLSSVLNGKTETAFDYFRDEFSASVISVGAPISLRGEIVGAVVLHQVQFAMGEASWMVTKKIAPWIVVCLALGVMLAGVNAKSIGRPIAEIGAAAREYANGNLHRRVDTSSFRSRETQELANTFNFMADHLERQSKARTEFVANASHELRSPLTNMHGYLQAMLDGTIPSEDYQKYMEIVDAETVRLSGLVNDLLNLSKIDSGAYVPKLSVFDINELLRRKLVQFATRIEEKEIVVKLDIAVEECLIRADWERIGVVLQNLMDNAIKFTPNQGTIRVSCQLCGDKAAIEIANSGPGISQSDLPYIFDRFYMADKGRKPGSGTGLGLALVDEILRQHGCRIECRSKPNRETVFSFALDIAKNESEQNEECLNG